MCISISRHGIAAIPQCRGSSRGPPENARMRVSQGRNRVTTLPLPQGICRCCLHVPADRLGEGNHPPTRLVPQRVARRAQPIGEGQHGRHSEVRMRPVAGFQPVIGNSWRDMVDVVETDIPCHPLQQAGQPEKRAATQRRVNRVPLRVSCPVRPLEVVLLMKTARHRRCSPAS